MRLYFTKYLEGRRELKISESDVFVMVKSFDAGMVIARNAGYRRKTDCLRNIERVNKAAGKEIAVYGGAFEVSR